MNSNAVKSWLPVIVLLGGLMVGYVEWRTTADSRDRQLADAIARNSSAIDKLSTAMERMTDLMITDARHDTEIAALRRDLDVIWVELQEHEQGQHPHDDHDTGKD